VRAGEDGQRRATCKQGLGDRIGDREMKAQCQGPPFPGGEALGIGKNGGMGGDRLAIAHRTDHREWMLKKALAQDGRVCDVEKTGRVHGLILIPVGRAGEAVVDGFAEAFVRDAGDGDPVVLCVERAQGGEEVLRGFAQVSGF
jgi:hypothetical protein